ncbi:MAG: hypothetical protein OEW42_04075 [Acidimicrobiia bacterium]|nr:hypothetical protein [Acidimicrobiia bacterium]
MMHHDVARNRGEPNGVLLARRGNVLAFGVGQGVVVDEVVQPVEASVGVGAGHVVHRTRIAVDCVEGDPHGAHLLAVGVEVGEILMEGGGLLRSWLLHQDAVLVEVHRTGSQQCGGWGRQGAVDGEGRELRDVQPVVDAGDEAAACRGRAPAVEPAAIEVRSARVSGRSMTRSTGSRMASASAVATMPGRWTTPSRQNRSTSSSVTRSTGTGVQGHGRDGTSPV